MSSFLCFICHSTVNSDTYEETREKYREVVGMNLCPDSHLCHICCHVLNKLWLFKSVCLKRSLEYPVLFSEKGTLNLQRNDLELHTICPEDTCCQYHNRNINSKSYHFQFDIHNYGTHKEYIDHQYVELEDERTAFDDYFNINIAPNVKQVVHETKYVQTTAEVTTYECKEVQTDVQTDFVIESPNNDYIDDEYENQSIEDTFIQECEEVDDRIDENLENVDYDDNEDADVTIKSEKESDVKTIEEELDQNAKEDTSHIPNEINNEITELTEEHSKKQVRKSKKKKKEKFEKITITLEQQKAELEAKRKEKKYIEADFKCYSCAMGFLFKDTYQAHMMRHEESNGEYLCSICTLRFATPAVLRIHSACHSARYRCTRCGAVVRVRSRQTHARQCWPRERHSVACHLCGNMFQDSSSLHQHVKKFHQSKTSNRSYSCSVCGKSYTNQAAVRTHMIKHVNRKFDCDQCTSTFSSPYTLNQHKKKHTTTEIQQYYCTVCNIGYSSRKSLLAHKRNALKHRQTLWSCVQCGRACPTRRALASHTQTAHSSTKRYACAACPARYSSNKSLVRHAATHRERKEPKTAVCHLCGATFKGNNKLNRHLREVCEKVKLEEELTNLYEQECMNVV